MKSSLKLSAIQRGAKKSRLLVCERSRSFSQGSYKHQKDAAEIAIRPKRKQARSKFAERDFFLSVLSATATKRDAKAYLSRFSPAKQGKDKSITRLSNHVALIKIRSMQALADDVVHGLVSTISQLNRLGLGCVVVIDCETDTSDATDPASKESRKMAVTQADRLVSGLEKVVSTKPFRLDDLLAVTPLSQEVSSTVQIRNPVEVKFPDLLARPLRRGLIPVIIPVAYTQDTQRICDVKADDVVLALTREFAGLNTSQNLHESDEMTSISATMSKKPVASDFVLDRIIVLDPVGAIPSANRMDHAHVFINLEQEYEDIKVDLQLASGLPSSVPASVTGPDLCQRQLRNLELLRQTLALLPPSSSAFLTTPLAAATLAQHDAGDISPGVGTRRPKNPLIFNLLTDKPLISSSLPVARMSSSGDPESSEAMPTSLSTFAKRGMQVTMIPDPRAKPWQPPRNDESLLTLKDPNIDLPRLLTLIEDSFNRPLDIEHYLHRVQGRLAGIIIAGEYEGGSILTWELPSGVPDDGSESSRQRMVPYLDKFAVLKRSQGAGGHADILFSAMVRRCFPEGVCWRSRKDNPVNKWYFERAVGTWKLPGTNWTMFWTDQDLSRDSQRFKDYESVCRSILPSWADNKAVVD